MTQHQGTTLAPTGLAECSHDRMLVMSEEELAEGTGAVVTSGHCPACSDEAHGGWIEITTYPDRTEDVRALSPKQIHYLRRAYANV